MRPEIIKMENKIVIAITGASGSIYAKVLFNKLLEIQNQYSEIAVCMSANAMEVWKHELEDESYQSYPFTYYDEHNFNAPFASGSSQFRTMIICPCTVGTLGKIASGIADNLITRAADVMLKERRKLILMVRETPFNLIHINNMKTITEAGGIMVPACPSFYSKPVTIEDAVSTVIERMLDLCGFQIQSFRWHE
jgi:4-hydroxy-3-polyprenylbenzoate decarboxylase